jgi:hypothetical protein
LIRRSASGSQVICFVSANLRSSLKDLLALVFYKSDSYKGDKRNNERSRTQIKYPRRLLPSGRKGYRRCRRSLPKTLHASIRAAGAAYQG